MITKNQYPSAALLPNPLPDILLAAQQQALHEDLKFAGQVTSEDAWYLFSRWLATLVDVRSSEELQLVGEVPHSLNVAWQNGPSLAKNPNFLQQLHAVSGYEAPLLFLCCCGKRSVAAAETATAAGFKYVFNIRDGFEGGHVACHLRGTGGWRQSGMPWVGA